MAQQCTESRDRDRMDMERLAAGQDAALNDLMERHSAGIFRFLFRMVGNEDDANDLAQETFIRVFRASSRFQPEKKFSTWLYTIAANLGRSHLRWRNRHPHIALETQTGSEQTLEDILPSKDALPNETLLASERVAAVRAAVNRLPPYLREALVLCEWEECSSAEAASILATTPKAVESRLYRARKILGQQLKRWVLTSIDG
ncbi:MAG TPA: RNA polymerase sigma factor [Verrucomicrobiae bacterium]|nr:RNA polymerase sigma factor [Verrucomicrobiae bacterium]